MSDVYTTVENDYSDYETHPGSYYPPGYINITPNPIFEKEYVKKLINDHWNYIEQVLIKSDLTGCRHPNSLKEIEFHYKTAFEHGWKHAMEYQKDVNY